MRKFLADVSPFATWSDLFGYLVFLATIGAAFRVLDVVIRALR
jgi:hypothetical protein